MRVEIAMDRIAIRATMFDARKFRESKNHKWLPLGRTNTYELRISLVLGRKAVYAANCQIILNTGQ